MAGEPTITVIGNAVEDAELRFTAAGMAVAKFRLANNPRVKDKNSGEWTNGESLFLTVQAYKQLAENTAETVTKGTRVIVQGALKQRSYETKEGEKRTVYELHAEEIGAALSKATAKVTRTARQSAPSDSFADTDPPF